jgi:cytochrome c oxidase assembly protein subunit 11
MSSTPTSSVTERKNSRVALYCVAVLLAMIAAGYAAVPLYRMFCQQTGFNGTVSRATRAPVGAVLAQKLNVSFDTNVRGLPWVFKAEQGSQSLQIGSTGLAFFTVTNTSDHPITGHAVYNVVPEQAGTYFHKLQCFCFTDQTIAAHTTMRFPVVYFVDTQFASDPDTKGFTDVTLSYTFYPAVNGAAKSAKTDPAPDRALGGKAQAGL